MIIVHLGLHLEDPAVVLLGLSEMAMRGTNRSHGAMRQLGNRPQTDREIGFHFRGREALHIYEAEGEKRVRFAEIRLLAQDLPQPLDGENDLSH